MKVRNLLGERLKTVSEDCQIESQALMLRGGYMKNVANGIYSFYPPTQRISKKIQQILREEMDRIDGQEVLFPVVMPASLWEQSGRYTSIGSEMCRFTDRSDNKMVLGMTHEEAAVQLSSNVAKSYTQYPYMIYQIQTKFRDEPRSRGGLIRVREFTMKDAYSFHTSQKDLEKYYKRAYEAYNRIFKRCGLKNFIAVKSDSGMMGGKISHEYMALTDIGEDTLVLCDCGYKSNMEVADSIVCNEAATPNELKKVPTPGKKTIEDVCKFLNADVINSCKAVMYQENLTDKYVVVFLRGDLEVNETKLRNYLKKEIHPAVDVECAGLVAGYCGPYGLKTSATIVYDKSLQGAANLVAGGNEVDVHYTGLNIERDIGKVKYVDVAKAKEGGICPVCGKPTLRISRGIEIGNIFQLGDKYTKSMEMTYLDAANTAQYPIMGCYGIGVGRLIAAVCQESRDEYGPIWPISIAPWQVEVCNLRVSDKDVTKTAEKLVKSLERAGIEVLYDDREVRPGFMFADADLFGVPLRVIVSPKTNERAVVEVVSRDKTIKTEFPVLSAAKEIVKLVKKMLKEFEV